MLTHTEFNVPRNSANGGRSFNLHRRRRACSLCLFPAIPVLPGTLVRLELLLDRPTLDLDEISETILTDMGATLQVFRTAASTVTAKHWRVDRVSDCVLLLGRAQLQKALQSVFPVAGSSRYDAARELWERARLTAEVSMFLARRVPELLSESAYLAGLLHEVCLIPATLGWCAGRSDLSGSITTGRAVFKEWRLPAFLEPTLLTASGQTDLSSPLARIIVAASAIVNERHHRSYLPVTVIESTSRPFGLVDGTSFASTLADRGQLFLV
jgi:HDOD domain